MPVGAACNNHPAFFPGSRFGNCLIYNGASSFALHTVSKHIMLQLEASQAQNLQWFCCGHFHITRVMRCSSSVAFPAIDLWMPTPGHVSRSRLCTRKPGVLFWNRVCQSWTGNQASAYVPLPKHCPAHGSDKDVATHMSLLSSSALHASQALRLFASYVITRGVLKWRASDSRWHGTRTLMSHMALI